MKYFFSSVFMLVWRKGWGNYSNATSPSYSVRLDTIPASGDGEDESLYNGYDHVLE